MTGYKSKKDAALDEEGMYLVHHTKRKDDNIQVYKKPWAGLTHEDLCKIIGVGTGDSDWNVTKVYDWLQKIEAALKEKNA